MFLYMQTVTNRGENYVDDVKNPLVDNVQDAWVRLLSSMQQNGEETPNASSLEELWETYGDKYKVFAKIVKNRAIDAGRYEARRAHAVLGDPDTEGEVDAADPRSEAEIQRIEAQDELDQLRRTADPIMQQVIAVVEECFALREQGLAYPAKLRRKITYLRQRTGLPLLVDTL